MPLPWVRLDTAFPSNPKILHLVADKQWRAIVVYVGGLSYAGAHGTDGFIPSSALGFLHGSKRDAQILVETVLWIPCQGGWDINGWAEFQPSNEETQRRRERAKIAAEKRWAQR
jgi:hypothetical protein